MKNLSKHLIYALGLSLLIMVIFIIINFINSSELPTWQNFWIDALWTLFFTFGLYFANASVAVWIRKYYNSYDWKSFVRKLIMGVLLSAVVTLVAGSILYFLMLIINGNSLAETFNWLFSMNSVESLQKLIWIAITIAIIFHVFSLIQNYQSYKLKEQKQKVVKISTQHESLKSQIGPHFLFNSLNVLNGLINENPDKAQEFVGELSTIYRYVLEQKDKALVPLRDEIEFSTTYMNLIQKRYEDGLEFSINVEVDEKDQIVPLSLQILLENCIKHNRISSEEPLRINVEQHKQYLTITNNLQPKNSMQKSTGKGLVNIIEQYRNLTKKDVLIQETENEFIVKIPILSEKILLMEQNQNYTEEEFKAAKKRVEDIQQFYWNLASYLIINSFFTIMDLRDGSYDWAYWPLLGWGIGVFFHAIEVFGFFNSYSWKEKMIQKELQNRKQEREEVMSNFKKS